MIRKHLYIYTILLTILCVILPHSSSCINVNKRINIAEQRNIEAHITTYHFEANKNDGVFNVVIDAGHGGHDSGCLGKHSKEKDISLSIALKVGEQIRKKAPHIEVIYTRKTDIFIPLHKRIDIANKAHADIFVSIHCNYVHNPNVCGSETFVMGLHRAEENLNVAKRENEAVLLEKNYEQNYEGYDPNSPVGHIILSMVQNLHLDQSIVLAASVENNLKQRKGYDSRGVKQAGFVVLRNATMPSILVETGFLSNRKEEKYLLSPNGQAEISASIGSSIISFFKQLARTRHQKKIATQTHNYTIQVGIFSSKENLRLIQLLSDIGSIQIQQKRNFFRYTLGRFATKSEAQSTLADVKSKGITDAFVKKL